MADQYGRERWHENIAELLRAGYSTEAVEWIVRSKIARWADDYDLSMFVYIHEYVGDAKLTSWINAR